MIGTNRERREANKERKKAVGFVANAELRGAREQSKRAKWQQREADGSVRKPRAKAKIRP